MLAEQLRQVPTSGQGGPASWVMPLAMLAVPVGGSLSRMVVTTLREALDEAMSSPPGRGARHRSPSWWLGTDQLGRDQLSRMLYAARVSLVAASGVLAASFVVGVTLGTIAGYAGGLVDRAVARLVDLTLSFPTLVVAWHPRYRGRRARQHHLRPVADRLTTLRPDRPRPGRGRPPVTARRRAARPPRRPRRIVGRHLLRVASGPALVYASIDVGFVVLSVRS
jgi:ABC-type dipeptide/oligopeptide/nickel transport system permease subunit